MIVREKSNIFRVLSIDGGGMRGLYTAAYLSSLAKHYAVTRGISQLDVGKGFELIIGTSTGAIVACALAIGLPLDNVAALYRERGPDIFPLKVPEGPGIDLARQAFRRPSYLRAGASALEKALYATFGETTLGDIWRDRNIALAIPAVEMSRHHAWVFKTPHLVSTRHRDDGYRLVDVCLATTAAPVYRSMARIDNPDTEGCHVFVDGGLWANNPVLVGLIEALEMTAPGDRIEIFCLGTCPRPEGELIGSDGIDRGLGGWQFGGKVVTLSIGAQEFAFDHMARMIARHVDRDCAIVRFPHGKVPAAMMEYLDLDETSSAGMDALVSQAQTDVYETLSRCGDASDVDGQHLHAMLNELPPLGGGVG
ncbi:MAG: CBASS cGAMP-activated phospholipase [Gammaproteobacteria bacterium]|jgi:hypothetical protein